MFTNLLSASLIACALDGQSAKVTFENRSDKSIPLQLPGIMNPNLSPSSKSRVSVSAGQRVYATIDGKRVILLTVCDEKDGDVVVVDELIARRTAELRAAKPKKPS